MSNISQKLRFKILNLSVLLGIVAVSCAYLYNKYTVFAEPIDVIQVELDKHTLEKGIPILYARSQKGVKMDFETVYKFKKVNDSIIELTNLQEQSITGFRIYFEFPGKDFTLKRILLSNDTNNKEVSLKEIKSYEHIKVQDKQTFDVHTNNGYLEYPYTIVANVPYLKIAAALLFLFVGVFLFFKKTKFISIILEADRKNYLFILFLLSLYSFAPIYNITLIIGLVFYIKDFSWQYFKENKINILFVLLFLVYFFNNLLIEGNVSGDFSTVERLLPMILIPVLMACIRMKNAMFYLMLSGLLIGFFLFLTSLLDFLIQNDYEYFSFSEFSKYYHPVYVSYLLVLIVFYLQQYYHHKEKYFIQLICFIFLIFLGSKLVLISSFILFLLFFLKVKRSVTLLLLLLLISAIFLFKPLQNRFSEVLNSDDLSILKESPIQDFNDSRINGLTLRLILWREALATMNGWQEVVFGNGVSKSKLKDLNRRLEKLGLLNHTNYNPHNQFIDTFWRTGFIGLGVLLLIFLAAFRMSLVSGNKTLMIFVLFMFLCMFTESFFGRVRGIYFFTTALLILTNSNFNYENSYNRHKRDSK